MGEQPGDRPLPLYISLPPLESSFAATKNPEKKIGVRRSEAAKPYWILDLRSAGNCLLLIYEINYVLDYYIDILLSIFSIFH